MPRAISATLLSLLAVSLPASAIIVGGTSGTGTNNDTQAGLDAYLATTSYSPFDYWDNLVRVNDASGVYLGYNPDSGNGWILGAIHVGNPGAVTVGGISFVVVNTQPIAGTDLLLLELGGAGATEIAGLPTIDLASTAAITNEFVLMTGRGYTASTSHPYPWEPTSTSDSQVMRWGTNRVTQVSDITVSGVASSHVITDFDSPLALTGPGAVTPYEGQVAEGDSGGGLFAYRGGKWVLIGIGHVALDASTPANSAEYTDGSGYTDVYAYRTEILGYTGTLVPEPSTAVFSMAALGVMMLRRRK